MPLLSLSSVVSLALMATPFEQYDTANGLHVVLSPDHTVPVVNVYIAYGVGSGHEKPGRTGFAHLFEHVMFQGSRNVGDDQHFKIVESVGGRVNGNTNQDRTVYFETLPSNYLERALWLESDRMGFLLDTLDLGKLDQQRDVVKNERRQNYENRPYALANEKVLDLLWPADFPYHWQTIGSMEDLSAASLDDVKEFFRRYYVPANAVLLIVGDFEPAQARALVDRYFGSLPAGERAPRLAPPAPAPLTEDKFTSYEDQVQVPRLYNAWRSPAVNTPGDAQLDVAASVLAGGRSSRLYRRLVFGEIASDVGVFQASQDLASRFGVVATARPGHTLEEIQKIVDEEIQKLASEPPTADEVATAQTQLEAHTTFSLESGLSRAVRMAEDWRQTGDPGHVTKDLETHRAVTAQQVSDALKEHITTRHRVVVHVVPKAKAAPAPAPAAVPDAKPAQPSKKKSR